MADKHDATKKLRALIQERADDKGLGDQKNLPALQDKMCDQLDNWLDNAPDFVGNVQVNDKSNGSML